MKNTGTIFFSLLILLMTGCKKKTAPPPYFGYDYYPVNRGHYVVYEVDSIVYDEFRGTVDTFRYQIKEEIGDVYLDNEERESKKVNRHIRMSDTSDWKLKDVWYTTVTNVRAERVEENIRYVKLYFPIEEGNTWNGNAKNTLDDLEYEYTEAHASQSIGGIVYDSLLTVSQADEKNLIEEFFAEEKYARGVGLVYKRYRNVETEIDGEVKSGVDYTMTAIRYGN